MTDRTTARLVGVLFIVATVTAIVGGSLVAPVLESGAAVASGVEARVVSGALLELVLVYAVVAIGALMMPVLRRIDEGLAITYLGARIVEGILLLVAIVSALAILGIASDAGMTGALAASALVQTTREWSYLAAPIAVNEMVLAVWLIVRGFSGRTRAAMEPRDRVGTG